jgi:hypothetical protein
VIRLRIVRSILSQFHCSRNSPGLSRSTWNIASHKTWTISRRC